MAIRSHSEARYRTVVSALPDVVGHLRDDGYVLDFYVPAAFATEFTAHEMVGKRLHEVIPPDLAAKFDDAVVRLRQSGKTVSYEYTVEVQGRIRHREVRMAPVRDGEVLSILRDVTPLREHEAALTESRAELRALAEHLQTIREDERTRLSREVHDILGQQLTAIRLGVGWISRRVEDDDVQERIGDLRRTIDETLRHVRQIAADLRPGVLDDFGLASAVEWQVRRFETQAEVHGTVDVQGAVEPPADVATAAFRVLQEALTNVARHARASRVAVTLVLGPTSTRLTVVDDGRGFDASRERRRRSLGLVGMRERATALGGTLRVEGTPGVGTLVECTLPISPPTP